MAMRYGKIGPINCPYMIKIKFQWMKAKFNRVQ